MAVLAKFSSNHNQTKTKHDMQTRFTTAYITCALWSSTDDDGEPLDKSHTVSDLAPEAVAKMEADCAKFQAEHGDEIKDNLEQAGHDFWLTRNHHGAGFWDGDWPDETGEKLTQAAHTYGEQSLYIGDDGQIYIS